MHPTIPIRWPNWHPTVAAAWWRHVQPGPYLHMNIILRDERKPTDTLPEGSEFRLQEDHICIQHHLRPENFETPEGCKPKLHKNTNTPNGYVGTPQPLGYPRPMGDAVSFAFKTKLTFANVCAFTRLCLPRRRRYQHQPAGRHRHHTCQGGEQRRLRGFGRHRHRHGRHPHPPLKKHNQKIDENARNHQPTSSGRHQVWLKPQNERPPRVSLLRVRC